MKVTQGWRVFAVLGVLALFGAQAGVSQAVEEAAQAPNVTTVSGEIEAVDSQAGTVSLKGTTDPIQQPLLSFQVTDQTTISKDKQPLKLADLKAGDKVMIECATKEGKEVANLITVQTAATP